MASQTNDRDRRAGERSIIALVSTNDQWRNVFNRILFNVNIDVCSMSSSRRHLDCYFNIALTIRDQQ